MAETVCASNSFSLNSTSKGEVTDSKDALDKTLSLKMPDYSGEMLMSGQSWVTSTRFRRKVYAAVLIHTGGGQQTNFEWSHLSV